MTQTSPPGPLPEAGRGTRRARHFRVVRAFRAFTMAPPAPSRVPRMRRVFLAGFLIGCVPLPLLGPSRADVPLTDRLKSPPPTEPADARKTFRTLDGFRMELVACEPNVTSPVAAAYDEDGRLFVVEMRDYPDP